MKVFLVLFLLFSLQKSSFGQNALKCKTPFGEDGACVPMKSCFILWRIVTKAPRPLSQKAIDFVAGSKCASGGLYCCRFKDIGEDDDDVDEVIEKQPQSQQQSVNGDITRHRNINQLDTIRCGQISFDRIAHGIETSLFEFPWMALLGYDEGGSVHWKCGGSVINTRYVLTAAHCAKSQLTTVRLGEYDISTDKDCMIIKDQKECTPPVQDIAIQRQIIHPGYQARPNKNDIAMLRLARDADFSKFSVSPICLPITEELRQLPLGKLRVTGWGTTETQFRSDKLLKADVTFVEKNYCESDLRIKLVDGQFCAKGANMEDPCKGDSGGPLQAPAKLGHETKFVQFGLVSFGLVGCGNVKARSDVFTDVRFYLDWILDHLNP